MSAARRKTPAGCGGRADREHEWRRRAVEWGVSPLSRLRIPLQPILSLGNPGPIPPGVDAADEGHRDEAEAEDAEERAARQDLTRTYLREIGKAKLLTAAREIEIGQRIEAGQTELRRALAAIPIALRTLLDLADRVRTSKAPLEANLRLVVSVAKRYLGSDVPLLDLVQEGNLGPSPWKRRSAPRMNAGSEK